MMIKDLYNRDIVIYELSRKATLNHDSAEKMLTKIFELTGHCSAEMCTMRCDMCDWLKDNYIKMR